MPFKSEKQRRWMYANEPEMATRWEKEGKRIEEEEIINIFWENEKDNSSKGQLGEKKVMKLTKSQLKRIVKEEKTALLRERMGASVAALEENLFNAIDEWVQAVDEEMGGGIPPEQLKGEVMSFVDGYFEETEYAASQSGREEELASQGFKNPSYG
jgi:hypothetical protein